MPLDALLPHLRYIDDKKDRMIALVERWANINSGSHNPQGINHMRNALKEAFEPLGDSVNEIDLSPRQALSPDGSLVSIPAPKGLSIIKRPNAKKQIFLNGHIDTVFGPDSPFNNARVLTQVNCKVLVFQILRVVLSFFLRLWRLLSAPHSPTS